MPLSPARRAPLAALVALAAAALTGCAASTVSGHGSALAGAPSTQDFPSSGAVSSPVPSVTDSLPVPSTPAATGTSAPQTPGGSGVLVTDPAGHFQVRMPATPHQTTEPGSFGGYKFTVHLATVKSPYIALAEGEDVTPALPLDQIDVTLRSAVSSFESSSGMTLISQKQTTFNGHTARSAILERSDTRYQLLVAAYSGSQIYLLFAPQGAKFDALAASFSAI
jgi:hypothetical protein